MEPDSTTTLQTSNLPALTVERGQVYTTSVQIAEHFDKRHDNVVRAIKSLDCSEEFGLLNFEETPYTNPQNGQTYPMYRITRDGFALLAMGFTGKRAAQWKEAYIRAFNLMEQRLHQPVTPQSTPLARPLTSYLPLVTEMARLAAESSQTLATIAPFAQALREEIWVEVMGQLQTDEASRWRTLVALLTALQPPALNDPKARANRMLQMERSLPALDTLPHEEAEDMMVLWVMRYVTHPDTHPDAGRLWKDVMKLLRTGHLEGLTAKGGAR